MDNWKLMTKTYKMYLARYMQGLFKREGFCCGDLYRVCVPMASPPPAQLRSTLLNCGVQSGSHSRVII